MQDLVIYQKMYDFILYLFPIVDRFPKHEKFALCVNIKNCCIGIARLTASIASWIGHAKRINAQQAVINILKGIPCITTTA